MTEDFRSVFEGSKKQAEDAETAKREAEEKKRSDFLTLGEKLKQVVAPFYAEAAAALPPDGYLHMSDLTSYPSTRHVSAPALAFQISSEEKRSSNLRARQSSLYVLEIYGDERLNAYEGASRRNPINSAVDAKTLGDFDRTAFARLLKLMSDDYHRKPERR